MASSKTTSSRRVYSAAMEIAQQSRIEASTKEIELLKAKRQSLENVQKKIIAIESKKLSVAKAINPLIFILSLTASFLIVSSGSWVNTVTAGLNALIVHASFLVLSIVQAGSTVEGAVLNTPYYKISLQGDWLSFYSLALPIVIAALLALFQKMTWLRMGMIFISLIGLAIIANIFRIIIAFGLALNDGSGYADHYFHNFSAGLVFACIFLGLIFVEFLFSPE